MRTGLSFFDHFAAGRSMNSDSQLNLYASFKSNFPRLETRLLTTAAGISYSYADAEQSSAQIANYLVSLGLKRGDRVSAQVSKSPQALWLYLAVVRAGLVFHPLNPAYTDEELDFFLRDAAPAILICDSNRSDALQDLCQQVGTAHMRTLDADGGGTLMRGAQQCSALFDTASTRAGDLAALVYSSGTTGRPKGIMLSHGNLVENIAVLVDCWGFSADDCVLHALPIFHVHGLFIAIGCALMSGASLCWLDSFDVKVVLKNLSRSTVMMGVPTYYTRLLAEPDLNAEHCARNRLFISGSAPLLADTFAEFERRTGHRILERYGMTETGMNTSNPLHGERRAGTVGMPLPGVEVRICGAENEVLATKDLGELQIRGPNVFSGYWNLPDKTAEDFTPDGFFVTGDQACMDSDGYISIVGRSKDMVISGGLNVYPKEIEMLIDALSQVKESAVIGLPDADFGEVVAAIVVLETGVGLTGPQIQDMVKARVAGFKAPKRVFFVEELPRNAMGKVQKDILRKEYGSKMT